MLSSAIMKIFTIVLANVFNGFLSGRFLRLSVVGFWGQILGMNWIMVCVEKPQNPQKELDWTEWFLFLENVKNDTKISASAKRLTENLWLFPLRTGLRVHNQILEMASDQHLKYKVFLLEDEPVLCE